MTRITTLACALVLTVWGLNAQQLPPRDAEVKPTFGTASVSGVVVDDQDPPRPVRRAIVTLTGGTLRPSRGAITDDAGRFALQNLPAGQFTLTVSRASFITSAYGAKRPGRQGRPIEVADGQRVEGLVVTLWRGAAIAGTITDEAGAPVPNIPVSAIPARTSGARLLTLNNNPTRTDSRGEFRIFGLEPGPYLVSARPLSSGGGTMTAPSEREVDAQLSAVYRGAAAQPPSAPAPAPQEPPKPFTYAPVFYPGTASVNAAAPVTLAPGQETTGLDFSLQRVSTSVVEGVVMRPEGTPAAGATVRLTAAMPPGPFAAVSPIMLSATARSDGVFRIPQVTPGDYRLLAYASAGGAPRAPATGFVSPGGSGPALYAQADVSVAGADISGLMVYLEPAMTITGRVVFDGAAKPPADLSQVRVWLRRPNQQASPGVPLDSLTSMGAAVRPDGTFQLPNVLPDTYLASVTLLGGDATWWPRSAMLGEQDLLDGVVEIKPDAPPTMVVTLSDRRTELSGTVRKTEETPAPDAFVIAYAADRRFWLPSGRRLRAVRADADGHYAIGDLPAGEYLVTIVNDLDEDAWQDAAFLEKLVDASTKVTIADGEKKVINLRLDVG